MVIVASRQQPGDGGLGRQPIGRVATIGDSAAGRRAVQAGPGDQDVAIPRCWHRWREARSLSQSGCPVPLNEDRRIVILVTMTILSLAEVKSHLSELVARVNSQHERVTVTVHGKPSAVLIATEDLESLEETIAILSDPDTLSRLAASEAELARGEGESEEQLAQAMNARRRQRA